MNQRANVVVRNQYVYLMDNATVNVFDCTDSNTGQRDIYYIQKGRIMDTVQFRETRRVPRNVPQNQQPTRQPTQQPTRQPQRAVSSSSDSDEDTCQSSSTTTTPATTTTTPAAAVPPQDSTDKYIDILASTRTVTDEELQSISNKLQYGRDTNIYHRFALRLGVPSSDIDRIHEERKKILYDTQGTIFLILKLWKAQTSEPTVGMVGRTLEGCGLQQYVTDSLSP